MNTAIYFIGANGNIIDLFNNEFFDTTDIIGMTQTEVSIATSTTPQMDGDTVNSVQALPKALTLEFTIKTSVDVELAKRYVLQTIKPKQKGRLRLVQGERTVEIEGIVGGFDMPRFTDKVIMQIPLHCSSSYWEDAEYIAVEISRLIDIHYFPVDENGLALPEDGIPFGEYDLNMTQVYTNDGDAESGMLITIIALAEVINPTIYKSDGSYIGINDTLQAGDEVVINTKKGEKTIHKNGTSIFSKIKQGSTFLQLETGDNSFTIDSDSATEGNMYFTVSFKRRFV